MKKVTIRYATDKDAELIADLSRQTFYDTFAVHNTPENMDKFMAGQFTRDALISEVGMPGSFFLLAFEEQTVAGYVRLREDKSHSLLGDRPNLEIVRIYVATPWIGKGVGHLLMQRCIHEAQTLDKEVIWLGVWEHNKRAIDFYIRWGFEKFSETTFALGDDPQTDWLMKKELGAGG